ncbi:unnamed protein product [Withania somnifera]
MFEIRCDSITNSVRTYFCGENASCFTSRTSLNPERKNFKCPKYKDKLEVATVKIDSFRESLNAAKIERDNFKKKLEILETINYSEVKKSRNLEEKLLKMKMLFAVFVGYFVANFKC